MDARTSFSVGNLAGREFDMTVIQGHRKRMPELRNFIIQINKHVTIHLFGAQIIKMQSFIPI